MDAADDRGNGASGSRSPGAGRRRLLIGLAVVTFWIPTGVAALVASALHHVAIEPGRRAVCRVAATQVSALLVGELTVGRCAVVTPWHLRVEDATLLDADGYAVARVGALDVRPSLRALLAGRLEVAAIEVRAPWVTLREGADGLALVEAVALAEPSDDDEQDDGGALPTIALRDVVIRDGSLDDLPEGLRVHGIAADARVDLGERIVVALSRLDARAVRDGEEVARLADTQGTLRLGAGAASELSLALEAPDDAAVRVDASLDWGEDGPTAVRGDVHATVTPALLERLGQGEAARALAAPVRADAHVEGPFDDLAFEVDLDTPGGRARVDGRLRPDRLDAAVEVPGLDVSAFLADVSARVEGRVEARVPLAGGDVEATADLGVHRVALPGLRVRRVRLAGEASGALPTPDVRLDATLVDLSAGDVVVRDARLQVEGGAAGYRTRLGASLGPLAIGDRRAEPRVDGRLFVRVDAPAATDAAEAPPLGVSARGGFDVAGVWPGGVAVELGGVTVGAEAATADRVAIRGEGLDVRASGRFAFDGPSDLVAEARVVDLAALGETLGLAAVEGSATARVRFRGTPARPELEARATLDGARFDGVPLPDGEVDLRWETAARQATVSLEARVPGGGGSADVDVEMALGRRADPVAALRAAQVDARVRLVGLDLAFLEHLPGAPALDGVVDATLDASGTLRRPSMDATVRLASLRGPGLPEVDGALDLSIADQRATVEVRVDLPGGSRLASVRAEVSEQLAALAAGADPLYVLAEPWSLAIDVPTHRLDQLPAPARVDLPIEVGVTGRLQGGDGTPASGEVVADARWDAATAVPGACGAGASPSVRAAISLADQVAALRVTGRLGEEEVLLASSEHAAPLEAWARSGLPTRASPLAVDVRLDGLDLARVPFACARFAGTVEGTVEAVALGTRTPRASVELVARDLVTGGSSPARLTVSASADARRAEASVVLEQNGGQPLEITAGAPLAVADDGLSVALGDGPIAADVRLRAAPLALLLAPAPNVARPDGRVSGHVTAAGRDLEDLRVEGELTLEDASLTLTDPFLRLERVGGKVALGPDAIAIEGLTAGDRSGSLEVNGTVAREGFRPGRVDLRIDADGYVARREGIRVATIDGTLRVQGDLRAEPPRLDVRLDQLDVELPASVDAEVQDLAPHPRVIYAGQPGFDRSLGVREALARHRGDDTRDAGRSGGAPFEVAIRSRAPFWVRHPSFSIQLETDVVLRSTATATTMEGPLTVRRGFIDLLGKSFEFQQGTIRFTGATPIDPALDLTATHRVASGHLVTVAIGGRLGDPVLTFTSTDPSVTSDTDVIASILGVRSSADSDDAESDAGSLLAGLVAGFVGSVTRRELGQYLPVLSVESAGTAQSTRVRAGFQADQVVPDAWRDVIRGVYVEGAVGGGDGTGESDAGVRAGFLIEVFLPRQLRATAEYEQPDNWSLDLTWEL